MIHDPICGVGHIRITEEDLRIFHLRVVRNHTRFILPLRFKQATEGLRSDIIDTTTGLTVATGHPFIQPIFYQGRLMPVQIADNATTKLDWCSYGSLAPWPPPVSEPNVPVEITTREVILYSFRDYGVHTGYLIHNNQLVQDPVNELRKLQILHELS